MYRKHMGRTRRRRSHVSSTRNFTRRSTWISVREKESRRATGNPRASYTYKEPDNLFKILDNNDENDTFLYGYDIILKHACPMAPKLKTVFWQMACI
jgi:hypothetical protein